MPLRNDAARYGSVARALHWAMAALLIATLIIAEARDYTPRGSDLRRLVSNTHYQIGVGIFILVWIRLAWRLRETEPAITPPLPDWQRAIAHIIAWAFYGLMIVLPILGVLAQQAEGHTVSFLGLALTTLIATDRGTSRVIETVHVWFGNLMIGLIVLHVGAAFYHAVVRRDDALARMLGARSGR